MSRFWIELKLMVNINKQFIQSFSVDDHSDIDDNNNAIKQQLCGHRKGGICFTGLLA